MKNPFWWSGAQNYLVVQPVLKYFTLKCNWITKSKSRGLSNESFEVSATSDNTLTLSVNYYGDKVKLRLTGNFFATKKCYIES